MCGQWVFLSLGLTFSLPLPPTLPVFSSPSAAAFKLTSDCTGIFWGGWKGRQSEWSCTLRPGLISMSRLTKRRDWCHWTTERGGRKKKKRNSEAENQRTTVRMETDGLRKSTRCCVGGLFNWWYHTSPSLYLSILFSPLFVTDTRTHINNRARHICPVTFTFLHDAPPMLLPGSVLPSCPRGPVASAKLLINVTPISHSRHRKSGKTSQLHVFTARCEESSEIT